jgi:hypothetical protein
MAGIALDRDPADREEVRTGGATLPARLGRAFAVLAACGLVTAALPGRAEGARLKVRPLKGGIRVQVVGNGKSPVIFRLDGRRIAHVRRPPYRAVVPGARVARRDRSGPRSRLTVRDLRTGRLLGRLVLVRAPQRRRTVAAPDILPPASPASYELPAAAVRVTSSIGLAAALSAPQPTDIVLADGVYDSPGPFLNPNGHRLWSARPGGAVLKAGISLGGNWGLGNGLVRGIAFDVEDPAKVLSGGIVHVWGTGTGTRVLDVTLEGHSAIEAGVIARQPEGLVVQRVVARNFTGYGVLVDRNSVESAVAVPPLLEDLDLANVSRSVPRSSNGRAEACLWVGNTAVVRRVRTRDCAWEGIWAGTSAHGALFEHLDVDDSGIGVYVEHFARGTTFQRMRIGPNVNKGVNCEWADPSWGSRPACVDNVIQDSYFDTRVAGVYLDEGTMRTTVRRSVFVNQAWAAIGDYRGVGNLADTQGNDYRGIAPGAVPLTDKHIYTSGFPS